MNLRSVDLNLLVAFDALMHTRHITRAGQRMGIGQPAMSAALSRLRDTFQDELFVKQGGEMRPTARAVSIAEELAPILRDIDRLFADGGDVFEPTTSRRTFALRLSDLMSAVLLPPLTKLFQDAAPDIALDIRAMGPDTIADGLERDTLDLAVSMDIDVPKTIQTAPLFDDRMVQLFRVDHPEAGDLAKRRLPIRARRVRVARNPMDETMDARALRNAGQRLATAVTVRHWLAVPDILRATDYVADVPACLARRFAADGGLAMWAYPGPQAAFTWRMYWHPRYDTDPGVAWLRDRLLDAVEV